MAIRILALMRLSRIEQYITITRTIKFARIVQTIRELMEKLGLTMDVVNEFESAEEVVNVIEKNIQESPFGAWLVTTDDWKKSSGSTYFEMDKLNREMPSLLEEEEHKFDRDHTRIEHWSAREAKEASHSLFKYMAIGLLVLLCTLPLSSGVSRERFRNISLTRDVLLDMQWQNNTCGQIDSVAQAFLTSNQQDMKIIFLEVKGTVYRDRLEQHTHLRESEMYTETEIFEHDKTNDDFQIIVDISYFIYFEHRMNIAFSTGVLLIFILLI